jgi:hypothetical protein
MSVVPREGLREGLTPEGRAVEWIANNDGRVVCKKDGDDKLMITRLTLMIDAAVAQAVREAVEEYRTKERWVMASGTECDLCEEVVTEWEWVTHGWSLACRQCLDRIRTQAIEAERERNRRLLKKIARVIGERAPGWAILDDIDAALRADAEGGR